MNQRISATRQPRRGVVLVAALVCLLIVMTMLGAMLLATLRSARQLHVERDLAQCEWLLQAGHDRAVFRFADEPAEYRGETWLFPAAEIVGSGDGQVTIEVARTDESHTQIMVVAEYPTGSERSIRRSRTFQLQPKPTQRQE